ncbi:Fe3+ hydroxamate ABC transporter substrate-binding protein [Ureibacillus thermophilus]|uniref:Fe3+ hydroxamate ABC transporter substrate-binding protein n=1 Tax=Ureibacillus thermophilus TaxID=367743 RepID=A0A4P6UNF3_9BACL|nr:Fe3+ hydroxamate ABC transporter substrate-binding protein [Ureibacillus thermophilus]QBK24484.1 Fe3+ hydroxamate ABC transporter substrate-binding protein [Ureibacillus thermophilus]
MSFITPKCMKCNKVIEENEEVLVQLRYPKQKGFTEIKAFLNLEGKFICHECSKKLLV